MPVHCTACSAATCCGSCSGGGSVGCCSCARCCGRSSTGCGGGNGSAFANQLDEALGDLEDFGRFRQRDVDEREYGAKQQRSGERLGERLAQPSIVFGATDPRHRDDALALRTGLALEDPLVAELLFLCLLLVEVALEDRQHVAAGGNLVDDGLSAAFDLLNAFAETRDALLRAVEMASHSAGLDAVAKEQIQCAELAEPLERPASLLEQHVLLALHVERVELARDRVQIALEAAELRQSLVDLRLKRLAFLRRG